MHDFSEKVIFHCDCGQLALIRRRGFVIFVHQTMRVCIMCVLETEAFCHSVHFSYEALQRIARAHVDNQPRVFLQFHFVLDVLAKQLPPHVLSQRIRCIVAGS